MKRRNLLLRIKSNWVTIITLILIAGVLLVDLFFDSFQYPYQAIGIMLLLIAVQNFIAKTFHMDDMKEKLGTMISSENGIAIKHFRNCFDSKSTIQMINDAEYELFFVISRTGHITSEIEELKKKERLKIRFLVMNFENPEVKNAYYNMRNYTDENYNNTTQRDIQILKKYHHIEIREADFAFSAVFYACDLSNRKNGLIKKMPLPNETNYPDFPAMEFNNSSEWYEIYRQHMENMWERAKS